MFPPCGAGKQVECICSVSLKAERSIRGNGGWSLLSAVTVFPPGNKKRAWKLSPVLNSDLCLFVYPTNLLPPCSHSNLLTPHTKIQTSLISMRANISVTGVIHTRHQPAL